MKTAGDRGQPLGRRKLLAIACAGALLGGCATPSDRAAKATLASQTSGRQSLLKVDEDFAKRAQAVGVAAAFHEFMAEDAVMLPAASDPLRGRAAIFAQLQKARDEQLTWKPMAAEAARSGDLGYTWGTYELSARGPDGQPRVVKGKYLSVWRRAPDGTWKLSVDIGNSPPKSD